MPRKIKPQDTVEEASEESFPASDSPAWTTGVSKAPKDDHNTAEMLLHEHQIILKMIKAMDHVVEDLNKNKLISQQKLADIQEFMHNFVEGYHHRKERRSLLYAVKSGLIPANEYPRKMFRQEHEKARKLEENLQQASAALPSSQALHNDELIKLVLEIKGLYFSHIQNEEKLIFPLIQALDKDLQESLYQQMQKIDKQFGPEIQKHLAQITENIAKK